MNRLTIAGALVACIASVSSAGGTAAEKGDARQVPAPKGEAGDKVRLDRSSKPRRVDAAECVNQSGAACAVAVKVGAKCAVTLTPETLFVRRRGPVSIVWEIQTAGWSFPPRDGIAFKGAPPEFDDGRRTSDRRWHFRDKGENRGVWRYGVTVVGRDGQTCTVDPGVVNDWP